MSTPPCDHADRAHVVSLLEHITPWDELERQHRTQAGDWIRSDAPLYRIHADQPPTHLVSYTVVVDEQRQELLLVHHRKAGLWLPSGGHVEVGETPWQAAAREAREELFIDAVPSALTGTRPFFITVTATVGPHSHADVSLWHLITAPAGSISRYDDREFEAIQWIGLSQILGTPLGDLDPHMHRFAEKLGNALEPVHVSY